MDSHGFSIRIRKRKKGRKKRSPYHTRNNAKNKERRNEVPFAQGGPKLKLPREGFSWRKGK